LKNVAQKKIRAPLFVIALLLIFVLSTGIHAGSAFYTPQQGDYFRYIEMTQLVNGTGTYSGYFENTNTTGGETMDSVSGNTVSANYSFSYVFTNTTGTQSGSMSGVYTFSDSTFKYINGTDDETSYGGNPFVNPSVWFIINPSLDVGSIFEILNTNMTIKSTDTTFYLPSEARYVETIFAQGSGSFQRNDVYGQFSANYIWSAWYDPTTGYIVAYDYIEEDTSSGASFVYTDTLYVTSSSYSLTTVSTPPTTTPATTSSSTSTSTSSPTLSSGGQTTPAIDYIIIAVAVVAVVAGFVIYFMRKGSPSSGNLPSAIR
jgi:hypothetical protein